jgi:hypothetical protein
VLECIHAHPHQKQTLFQIVKAFFEAWRSPLAAYYYYPPGTNSLFPPTSPRFLAWLTISRVAFQILDLMLLLHFKKSIPKKILGLSHMSRLSIAKLHLNFLHSHNNALPKKDDDP